MYELYWQVVIRLNFQFILIKVTLMKKMLCVFSCNNYNFKSNIIPNLNLADLSEKITI